MARVARQDPRVDPEALATRAAALVAAHGAVPRSDWKVFRPHVDSLRPLLAAKGVELGATTIRRPLAEQISDLVRAHECVAAKGLEKRVKGANAREVAAAVDALVSKKLVVRILRANGPGLVSASTDVVGGDAVADLTRRIAVVQKLLKASSTKKMSLLESDVEALISSLSTSKLATTKASKPAIAEGERALADEIARRVRATKLPMRVPDLLRALGVPFDDAKRALVEGAARGLFDLEPESGMGRLSPDDALLCPAGPMGTRLSWVRARADAGAKG